MKKKILMIYLGVLFAGSTTAADGFGHESKVNHAENPGRNYRTDIRKIASERTDRMVDELKLNKKQERELQSLNMKHAQKIQDIIKDDDSGRGIFERNNRNLNKIDKREQALLDALDDQYNSELKGILTAEQYRKYQRSNKR